MSSATKLQHGFNGFKRITDADGAVPGEFYAIKAISSDVTFGAGCVARVGDAPAEGDPLAQGDVLYVRLTTLELATGTAYAYHEETPEE